MNLPSQEPVMQSGKEAGSMNQLVWMQESSPWMPIPSGHGLDNMVGDLAMPKMDNLDADGTLHSIINDSVHSVDVPLQNPNFQDSEMFSWLHFPIDDTLDKGFCNDLFKDLPGSNAQIVKHSFNQLGLQQETLSLNVTEALLNDILPPNTVCSSITQVVAEVVDSCSSCPNEAKDMVAGADAAMVVDGGCATIANTCNYGVDSISGLYALGRPPVPLDNCMQVVATIPNQTNMDMVPLSNPNLSSTDLSQCHLPSLSQGRTMLPVGKSVDVSFCSSQPVHRNFAHFSSAVAETRASLHAVSVNSGLTSVERARQPYGGVGKVDCHAYKQPSQRELLSMETYTRHVAPPLQSLPAAAPCVDAGETSKSKSSGEDHLVSSHLCNSAVTASNRAMEKLHITEQTATSPSRGSGSSSEKSGKDAVMALKRRLSGADDSECQSEDLEDTTNNSKKSVKRSRAAQMHNLCERKRRDRINEKLLALRDLMPNSSKTAKASILDEAIEYVKLLQSQLQTWSARTGIGIPPALIPSMGLQPVQMPALPHMGIGMGMGMGVGVGVGLGMGMGMGMGLVDASAAAAAGRTMMPMPPYPAQPHPMGSLQPCLPVVNMGNGQDHLQSPHMLDPYSMYVPHHQAQQIPVNLTMFRNMELYNAYMQGQQQQQHQWHQLQQQHQWQLLQQQQPQGNATNKPTQ